MLLVPKIWHPKEYTPWPPEGEIETSWCRRSNGIVNSSRERNCSSMYNMGFCLTKDLIDLVIVDYLKDNGIENPFATGQGLVAAFHEVVAHFK